MRMYFDRKTKQDRLSAQYSQKSGRRYMSWLNWGGDPGAVWSKSKRYRELVKSNPSREFLAIPGLREGEEGERWISREEQARRQALYAPSREKARRRRGEDRTSSERDLERRHIELAQQRSARSGLPRPEYTNEYLMAKGMKRRNPAPGITMTQWLADVYGEDWANWELNRAGIMHYSPKGMPTSRSIVRTNPFEFKPEGFDQRLRRIGMTGHTIYREDDGEIVKSPKMIMFDSPDAALQALAVFLVLENIDTRGASPVEMQPRHAAVRLRDGRVYEATLRQDGKALTVQLVGSKSQVDWFDWARQGDYPALASSR
jgi:hypothetical protein